MNWEDTVMDLTDMGNYSLKIAMTSILKQQAEISFKAGEQLALEKQGRAYLEGKQSGIELVVGWIDGNKEITITKDNPIELGVYPKIDWQAQKKIWLK